MIFGTCCVQPGHDKTHPIIEELPACICEFKFHILPLLDGQKVLHGQERRGPNFLCEPFRYPLPQIHDLLFLFKKVDEVF